jgi:hypothetical protein
VVQRSRPSPQDLRHLMPDVASLAHLSRAAALDVSGFVDLARSRSGAIESARLSHKLGASSVRTRDTAERAALAARLASEMASESERFTVPSPDVDEDKFAVYGRVVAPERSRRGALIVSVVSGQRKAIAETRVDDRGRFEIVLDAPPIDDASGVEYVKEQPRRKPSGGGAHTTRPGEKLFLAVSVGGKEVGRSEEGFQLAAGKAAYREIVLKRDIP